MTKERADLLMVARINQEELGYLEDEYEDLKALFLMFDFDQVTPSMQWCCAQYGADIKRPETKNYRDKGRQRNIKMQ